MVEPMFLTVTMRDYCYVKAQAWVNNVALWVTDSI